MKVIDLKVILLHLFFPLIFLFIFWMILDCIKVKRKSLKYMGKIEWLLVMLLLPWIGELFYYFLEKRRREK